MKNLPCGGKIYQSVCEVSADVDGQEIKSHGTFGYPVACYLNDMTTAKVISHWHSELELIFVTEGRVIVGAAQLEKILHKGDGCFINSNVLHDVRQIDSEAGTLKSIVFHSRLIGGRGDIFWLKFLQPLIEDGRKEFIFFDAQKDLELVSLIIKAWAAQSEEKFGFEFEVRNFLWSAASSIEMNKFFTGRSNNDLRSGIFMASTLRIARSSL